MRNNTYPSVIFSDCRNVIQVWYNPNPSSSKPHLILTLCNLIFIAKNQNLEIALVWVRGKRRIPGNETADDLARLATVEGSYLDINLSFTDVWAEALSQYLQKTTNNWKKSFDAQQKTLQNCAPITQPGSEPSP